MGTLQSITESGVCTDAYQRLMAVIGVPSATQRFDIIDAIITFQDQGATVVYMPNGQAPPAGKVGTPYPASDGFALGVYTTQRRRLDWYYVKNTTPGSNATVVVEAFGETQ